MKSNHLLCIMLLAAPLWVLASTPIDQTQALNADGRVSIENLKGSVQVRTWERAEVHIGGSLGDGVKQLQVEGNANSLRIKVDNPDSGRWFGNKRSEPSDLVVTVPATAEVEVEVVSADVDVAGVAGRRLSVDSVSGRINAQGKPARAELRSVSGDVEATLQSPRLKAESVSGDVRVNGTTSGEIALETVSGDIHLEAGTVKQLSMESVSGSVEAQVQTLAPDGRINGETLSGRLTLSLPATTSAAVHISTFSGAIRSDVGKVVREEYGPGASLEARLGEGNGKIELESFSGSVRLDVR